MKSPLHILHLEDDPQDATLIQSTLEAAGIVCTTTRVQNRPDFVAALERGGIDLILSDFSLPSYDGLSAATIVRSRWPGIPLILVSGTLGEELAIDSFKSGATDYVLKDRLGRLAPAVRRAMLEVDERTEHRRVEAQFVEAQKMEVVGQLAGGVAHDFNNLLSVILGYSEMITARLEPDSPLRKCAEEIRNAAERGAGLTKQLLVFSRRETVNPVVLDLNAVVRELGSMLRQLVDGNINLTVLLGEPAGHIRADSGHVGQVLMNLVVNARDAMPTGGELSITTRNVRLDEQYVQTHAGVQAGDYVMLSVSDTGTGMTEEVKRRLFEAFFTTKPTGKGTGLGLAICQTILRQSGGHIEVCSELGQGTTFSMYFPCVALPVDAPARPPGPGPLPRGTETVLVVEDEPALRRLTGLLLKGQGYEVLFAANGEEALQMARARTGAPIRLVVTDVIMPLMGGVAMAEQLQASYPDLRILFTSGYTDGAVTNHGVLGPGVQFLAKPYSIVTLTLKIRELLDETAAPHSPDSLSDAPPMLPGA